MSEPFEPLDLDAFLARPPEPPDWDLEGWFARGDLVVAFGDPGAGKSIWVLAFEACASMGGGEHLGDVVSARRVLFVDLESPADVVYTRLRGFGLRGSVDGFAYLYRPASFDLLDVEGLTRLRATIVTHAAEVVAIDSLRRAAPGLDENDSRAVSLLLSALRTLAAELRVTILVVHHPRKPVGEAKVEALYAARGSGDLIGSCDSAIFFRRLPGGLVRVEHAKARRGREHEHVHYRIVGGSAGEPVLEHVEVEATAAGDELVEQVVAFVTAHPGAPQKDVEAGVTGGRQKVRAALEAAASHNLIARGDGRHPSGKYWFPASQAESLSPGDTGATPGDTSPAPSQGEVVADSPTPRRGGATAGDTFDGPVSTASGDSPARPLIQLQRNLRTLLDEHGISPNGSPAHADEDAIESLARRARQAIREHHG